jgi:hypothetical protein
MKKIVITGAFLLVSACATPVLADPPMTVTIDTFTVVHKSTIVIDGVPYDPEVDGGDGGGALYATQKDVVTVKATFSNALIGYVGKYTLADGSSSPAADGSLNLDSVFRYDHKGKAGTRTYTLTVWFQFGSAGVGLGQKSENRKC